MGLLRTAAVRSSTMVPGSVQAQLWYFLLFVFFIMIKMKVQLTTRVLERTLRFLTLPITVPGSVLA